MDVSGFCIHAGGLGSNRVDFWDRAPLCALQDAERKHHIERQGTPGKERHRTVMLLGGCRCGAGPGVCCSGHRTDNKKFCARLLDAQSSHARFTMGISLWGPKAADAPLSF